MRATPKLIATLFNLVCDLYGWNRDPGSGEPYLYLVKSTPGAYFEILCHLPSRPHVPSYPFGCGGRKAADMETWLRGMMDAWHAQYNHTFSIPRDYRQHDDERPSACKVAIKINADNDVNGNPRRGWLVYGPEGRYLGFVDEGYNDRGLREAHGINVMELGTVHVKPGEYRDYQRNPEKWARPVGM